MAAEKDFERSFNYVVGQEGVFSDDPDDDGNWTGGAKGKGELRGTKYGISAKAYPGLDIKSLTLAGAKSIYLKDYWAAAHCSDLSPELSFCVFDCAVNQGVVMAVKCLQRAAGVNDDGKFGPHTRDSVGRLRSSDAVEYFQAERMLEYVNAARWSKYGRGWTRRLLQTAMEAQ